MLLEVAFLGLGLAVYAVFRSLRHPLRLGRLTLLMLVVVGTYFGSQFGPLPSSMTLVAVSDIVFVLGVAWLAAWADRRAAPGGLGGHRRGTRGGDGAGVSPGRGPVRVFGRLRRGPRRRPGGGRG